jgi:hypothetical protein
VVPALRSIGATLVVDVREATTDVCVLRNGRAEVARTLSEGMKEAREGKRAALEASLRRTLAGYRALGGPEPERVFLCGDATVFHDSAEWLKGVLSIDVQVLPLPALPGTDATSLPRFARATALAARVAGKGKRLDLRQGDFAPQQTMGALRKNARLLAVCALSVLVAFGFSTFARWWVLDSERETLRAQLRETTEDLFAVPTEDPVRARELLQSGGRPADPLPSFDAFDALDRLSKSVPPEVPHDVRRLIIDIGDEQDEGELQLEGELDNQTSFEAITAALRQTECFTEVNAGRTQTAPNDRLKYELGATIRCPGQAAPTKNRNRNRRSRGG